MDERLKEAIVKQFRDKGYENFGTTLRGLLFVKNINSSAVIIDHDICNKNSEFSYTEYVKEQNSLMYRYNNLYRFLINNHTDIRDVVTQLEQFLKKDFNEDEIHKRGRNREFQEIDPTIPEALFEQAFIETYGRESLSCVSREYPVLDINGSTRYVDYYIETNDHSIAIEKNGEVYHHPIITGRERYKSQLVKQNSLVAYGMKVFRWSIKAMKFSENFSDELRKYIGDPKSFKKSQKISISRAFQLFDHQSDVLASIGQARKVGQNSFLVVLPTGTGKTEIMISDIFAELGKIRFKALVMVPGKELKYQIIKKFRNRLKDFPHLKDIFISEDIEAGIVVKTYSWMSRYFQTLKIDKFKYIAVDEAHHAVAPTVRKVIQHFNPRTLVGFTATDKRPDTKKLEDVFGKYESDLTLLEAIKRGLLAPIKAFRLKSNIDLSEIRFNGKDYLATDLQRSVVVPSRDQLVVDLLIESFVSSDTDRKQGIIFCVSIKHANDMAKRMQECGIAVKAVSGSDNKSSSYIEDYKDNKLQFLTTCSLLNEGWDSPQTSIIVMARPTMSQVLYTQQLGRGTRKYPGKDALYVIDVVDNYGGLGSFKNTPWSVHSLLGISSYYQWDNLLETPKMISKENIQIDGLYEYEKKIEKIDIFTFEKEYANYLSDEQFARELFVSTGTVKSWLKSKKIVPEISIPFGRKKINYFSPGQVVETIETLGLKRHDDTTLFEDFYEFLEKGDYSMSYKIVMMLSLLDLVDHNGECSLDDLVDRYSDFYIKRHMRGEIAEKETSPYSKLEFFDDKKAVKLSLLQNPFEKFERKRFMYHCKDLNHISFSTNLWSQINNSDNISRIKEIFLKDLEQYYKDLEEK